MTGKLLPDPHHPVGSFAEAARFRLSIALGLSHRERLRDLESMWDFNDMIEARNPRVRHIAAVLRARHQEPQS